MINSNYYTIDWKRMVRWNLPVSRRKPRLLAMLYALIYPVVVVYQALIKYKKAKQYQLLISPQVCYLERLLNDRFDYGLRRIRIDEPIVHDPWYLFQEEELKPEYLFTEGENQPVYLFTESEAGEIKDDFIVLVPAGLSFDSNELKSLLNQFRLAGKKYSIKIS